MVRLIEQSNVDSEIFTSKKVICFGTGKRFHFFREMWPQISVSGLIDNYKCGSFLDLNGKSVLIWSPEEAAHYIDTDSIIIITSIRVEEIVAQLDQIEELNGIFCYAEAALDNYAGLSVEQKLHLERLIPLLAQRTPAEALLGDYGWLNQTADIKKYQIWHYLGMYNTAGNKAKEDIKRIAGALGYQVMNVHFSTGEAGTEVADLSDKLVYSDWEAVLQRVPCQSLLLLQMPMQTRFPMDLILQMKEKKDLRFITVVHDVDMLRKLENYITREDEFKFMLEVSDCLIVHNEEMVQYFKQIGINPEKLISLQIFDYLHDEPETEKIFERAVIFAGNLSAQKSPFVYELGKLTSMKVYLYGSYFSGDLLSQVDNVVYGGSILADFLPQKLDRGFGLIWDGDSINTCSGDTGEYLRYNNPHKMSLYLASGLPVVIWNSAAQARFVEENGVGVVIDSLYSLHDVLAQISEKDYRVFIQNVQHISEQLKSGHYMRTALKKAEKAVYITGHVGR